MQLRSKRFWLACFLMVLLPIKGFAVTAAFNCHQSTASVASAESTLEGHHAPSHEHHHAAPAHAQAAVDADSTHTGTAASADLTCGHCSPCCASAGLPSHVTLHFDSMPQEHAAAQPSHSPPTVTTARLERPPRNLA